MTPPSSSPASGCGVFYLMDNDFEIFLDSIPYAYGQTGTNTMNQLALYCNGSGCKHIDKDTDHLFSNLRWPSTTSSPSTKIYAPNMYGTAFIIAGILGISLCFYGIKHFYSLLNLKQEVDYFTKLNLQFHRERRALSKEVGRISTARKDLRETQQRLRQANAQNLENLENFREIQGAMDSFGKQSLEELADLQQKGKMIESKWRDQLYEHERELLHTVFERMERQGSRLGMNRDEFKEFENQLPDAYRKRFDRLRTFDKLSRCGSLFRYQDFRMGLDLFAEMTTDNVDIEFEIKKTPRAKSRQSSKKIKKVKFRPRLQSLSEAEDISQQTSMISGGSYSPIMDRDPSMMETFTDRSMDLEDIEFDEEYEDDDDAPQLYDRKVVVTSRTVRGRAFRKGLEDSLFLDEEDDEENDMFFDAFAVKNRLTRLNSLGARTFGFTREPQYRRQVGRLDEIALNNVCIDDAVMFNATTEYDGGLSNAIEVDSAKGSEPSDLFHNPFSKGPLICFIVGVLASLGCGVFYLMDNDFEIFLDSIPYAYGQTGTNTMNQLALYCNGSGCKHIDKDTDHLFSNLRWPSTTSSPSTKIYAPNMYGTAFIIAGILGISLCFYGIKHFHSSLNLKQAVAISNNEPKEKSKLPTNELEKPCNSDDERSSDTIMIHSIEALCNGHVSDCFHVGRLEQYMKQYKALTNELVTNAEIMKIDLILNDFLHCVQVHDTNDDFHYIHELLDRCQIASCSAFRRNYRDRHRKRTLHENDLPNYELTDPMQLLFHKMKCLPIATTVQQSILDALSTYSIETLLEDIEGPKEREFKRIIIEIKHLSKHDRNEGLRIIREIIKEHRTNTELPHHPVWSQLLINLGFTRQMHRTFIGRMDVCIDIRIDVFFEWILDVNECDRMQYIYNLLFRDSEENTHQKFKRPKHPSTIANLFKEQGVDGRVFTQFVHMVRSAHSTTTEEMKKLLLFQQVLDKIHCYYQHSYDQGHRLTNKEISAIESIDDEMEDCDDSILNQQLKMTNQIIQNKLKQLKMKGRAHINHKFTSQSLPEQNADKLFSFGFIIEYDKGGYDTRTEHKNDDNYIGYIQAKYSSLKEELLHNQTSVCARISIGQYHTELQKAIVHQKSAYYAQHYHEQSLPLSNILCILIYCNYDSLQFAFSKTYRKLTPTETLQSVGERHSYFWHLGKCLLESMSSIGVPVMEDSVNSFYHGIGDKLVFPSTANRQFVYGPLSTSSSFAAACVFTNNNNGIIVEFGDDIGFATQLPVGWLSDFTSESEHLFLGGAEGLKFINITIAETGEEYKYVLQALELIHDAINRKTNDDVCRKVQKIAKQLLQCHLQPECDKYVAFNIHAYGAALSDRFFMGIETVHVHCEIIKECYAFLEGVVLDEGLNWIDMEVLIMLFPNVSQIVVEVQNGVDLRPDWLLQIESNLKCIRQSKSEKLNTLRINIDCKRNFNSHFEDNGFQISFQTMQNMNDVCHYVTFELKDESFPCHCF
eukprot:137001_1